jgi:hypothetical protein
MLKSPHILLVLAGFFLLLNSCKRENLCDCFKPHGETILETRTVDVFNAIHAYDKIDVYFTQDTSLSAPIIQVKTGKHLMSNIKTEVSGNALVIENKNKCNFVRGVHNEVTVYVSAPYVKYFEQDGVGNIFGTNTVKQDTVYMNILNSGDIHLDVDVAAVKGHTHGIGDHYLKGKTDGFFMNVQGQGFVNALDLAAGYTYIYFNSNGEAHLQVLGQLDAEIPNTGNIYYKGGAPVVNAKITGSGKLFKL